MTWSAFERGTYVLLDVRGQRSIANRACQYLSKNLISEPHPCSLGFGVFHARRFQRPDQIRPEECPS